MGQIYEKFFEMTKESEIYRHYFNYLKVQEQLKTIVNKFVEDNGILTKDYAVTDDRFWIKDSEENRKAYSSQLSQNYSGELVAFKKNSKIGRNWSKLNVNTPCKPYIPNYLIEWIGAKSTRLFNVGDKLYGSIKYTYDIEFRIPKGMVEIKASEFYKIVEDYENS